MALEREQFRLILEYEKNFAERLAAKVLKKPEMNLWMILIPIIFVFYLNDLKKFRDGCRAFAGNYLLYRECALQEAAEVAEKGRIPALLPLTAKLAMSAAARKKLVEMLEVLVEQYTVMLRARGEDYQELLVDACGGQGDYAAFLQRLGEAEKDFNRTLAAQEGESAEEFREIIAAMERHSADIRSSDSARYFA